MKLNNQLDTSLFNKAQSGLTLIELMIAVAIIGVLASIALPAYQDYTEKAKINKAISDITGIAAAIDSYWKDAGVYPLSLADVGAGGMLDPWGNAYLYLDLTQTNNNGHARKDRNLVPINSDFDLYSKGKDGKSASPLTSALSKDDIIRANDGRFIDIASKY